MMNDLTKAKIYSLKKYSMTQIINKVLNSIINLIKIKNLLKKIKIKMRKVKTHKNLDLINLLTCYLAKIKKLMRKKISKLDSAMF